MSKIKNKKNAKITQKAFIPLTSIKQSVLFHEIAGKEHEFYYFTKKGKIKYLDIDKKLRVLMEMPSKYKMLDKSKELKKSCTKLSNGDKTNLNDMYFINFKDFYNSVKSFLFDSEKDYDGIKAVLIETGEITYPWVVCKTMGSICDKNDKELIQIRFDL